MLYPFGSEKPSFKQMPANISYVAIWKLELNKPHDFNIFSIQLFSEVKRKGWEAALEVSVILSKAYAALLLFHVVNILYTDSK